LLGVQVSEADVVPVAARAVGGASVSVENEIVDVSWSVAGPA